MSLRCADSALAPIELVEGECVSGFTELQRYFFAADVPGAVLYIDDACLPAAPDESGFAWTWEPGYFAGAVDAELIGASGERLAGYRFDVSPSPGKLGSAMFSAMVAELFDFDPRLVLGSEEAQHGIGVQGDVTNAHLEYARIRRYGHALVAVLKMIGERPLLRLRMERERRSPQHVKRIDAHTIRLALKEPAALYLLHGGDAQAVPRGSPTFDIQLEYEHADNPANRALAATLLAVMRRVRLVSEKLQLLADAETGSETRTPLAPRIVRRRTFLDQLSISLRRIARSNPFSTVARPELSAAGLNAISAHPTYSRAFRHGWYILRPGVVGETTEEGLWISPTWEIYERWCFLKVVNALQRAYPELTWTQTYPTSREDCVRFRGQGGGATVDAWLQARCPAGDQKRFREFGSISGERTPDILISMEAGRHRSLVVIDAKYRTSRAGVLDGMQSAHVYRDCIRWNGLRPVLSLLAVPRCGGATWLESAEFRREHGVGVIQLGADSDVDCLSSLLAQTLGSVAPTFVD